MESKEIFKNQKYLLVDNFISKETAKFLYDYLLVTTRAKQFTIGSTGDGQVPQSISAEYGDPVFETLLWVMKNQMEKFTGLDLIPSYTYRRLYKHGNILEKHTDRPSCEISVTIKLSDSGEYNWPIWMVDTAYELEDGDAVIYRGCDLEHWRESCEGPLTYTMGQVFLHYVDKNGPHVNWAYDKRENRKNVFESLEEGFLK